LASPVPLRAGGSSAAFGNLPGGLAQPFTAIDLERLPGVRPWGQLATKSAAAAFRVCTGRRRAAN
jgi:hypothetical protein